MNSFKQIAIYGVGLMGASIGLAARERQLADKVVGIGRNEEKLEKAKRMGCVHEYATDPKALLPTSDLVILCTPVAHIIKSFPDVAAAMADGAIVTDVGSTKKSIVEAAEQRFNDKTYFVGSHPMCGSEKSGAAFASADLYEGACCLVTPTAKSEPSAVQRVADFWTSLGGRVEQVSPAEHDYLMASLSHAPHIVAVALIESIRNLNEKPDLIREVSGNGLRDTTRIAEGSASVWRDICLENREEIVKALDRTIGELQSLRNAIAGPDSQELENILDKAARFRANL